MTDYDYSSVFDLVNDDLFEIVQAGAQIDPRTMVDTTKVVIAAAHCCINGPVGVAKRTTIPGIEGEVRIKDLFTKRVSNKTWKGFCAKFAVCLQDKLSPLKLAQSQSVVLNGALWPIAEWPQQN